MYFYYNDDTVTRLSTYLYKRRTVCHNESVSEHTITEVKKQFPQALVRTYGAGQVIIYDGDAPEYVHFITKGSVKFYDTNADGNENIMYIGGIGSIFPLFYSFEDKNKVDGFYATICKTEVLMIPRSDFRRALQTSVDYTFKTLQWYATEMDHMILRLKSMEKSAAKQKVLQALAYLCEQHTTSGRLNGWQRVNFPITQQTIADLCGLTRETVNVTLQDPEFKKLVRHHNQIFSINKAAVTKLLTV